MTQLIMIILVTIGMSSAFAGDTTTPTKHVGAHDKHQDHTSLEEAGPKGKQAQEDVKKGKLDESGKEIKRKQKGQ